MVTYFLRNGQSGTSRKKNEILDRQLRPKPLYRTRGGHSRPALRGVTASSSTLADALEGKKPTPGGEGGG